MSKVTLGEMLECLARMKYAYWPPHAIMSIEESHRIDSIFRTLTAVERWQTWSKEVAYGVVKEPPYPEHDRNFDAMNLVIAVANFDPGKGET